MPRKALPWRRPNKTVELELDGQRYSICVGYDRDGKAQEVFANGPRIGSTMQAVVADACVVISIALQNGLTPKDLEHSLGRVPRFTEGRENEGPASVVGLIVGALEDDPVGVLD